MRERGGKVKGSTRSPDLSLATEQRGTAGTEPGGEAGPATERHARHIHTAQVRPDRLASGVKEIGMGAHWRPECQQPRKGIRDHRAFVHRTS